MASILAMLYVTAFVLLYYKIVLTTFFKLKAIFLMKDPKTLNPGSSTNEKTIIERQVSKTK